MMPAGGLKNGIASSRSEAEVSDANLVIELQQARGSRLLLWVSLLAVVALIVWASMGSIDEVVRGEGKVVPSRQVQIVQSLDGGIVEEILIRPGQAVEAGQTLLRIDPTRQSSSLGENQAEMLSLTARAARLEALATGEPFVAPEEVLLKAPQVVEMERRVWESRTQELNAAIKQAQDQLKQREQELRETQANRDQAASSCGLTSRELQVTRPLLKSGAVSEVDLLRLQRDVARYCGEAKAAGAQIDRIHAAIDEASTKVEESELTVRNQARVELSEVRGKLATLQQGQVALVDRVNLAEVRSPVRGTIKSLMANTVGGVVQPGKDILEIVPTDDTLLLEVRVNPRDIGFLHPDQKAEVKFTAYDFAIYGGLQGQVEQIGADTITDEKGNSFYIVKVRTDRAYVGDDARPIIPGMVAEVHILTGKRTVMQYLLKPVLRARANAFTER
ncbi:HlyD family type I secretion periplasmic adaptor subunit [Pusillimonas sp. SM2304]|uniref:HlyD family type I secretion periplasmic adaptor subunit n=1 Tax=Pusillimonas sp. SM2304 TaxID=3073241 RepID=UPI002876BC6F|nr:HlyD family type I secretion periplasmic adaptor subunit [Pusillimonas sp. SM2304]MDS1139637.1 HlyD family type I secretion periplasmic adaptor subunit [Pusillimonas sp. SM2304]